MKSTAAPADRLVVTARLHATFQDLLLPRIELHGRVYFRFVRCPDTKAEFLAGGEKRGRNSLRLPWHLRGSDRRT